MPSDSIDLIATDPPFNTGKDWGQFNDKWDGGLDGYLDFMKPRLQEMHRLLKDTGSLYLHCDTNASHYLKVMLDGIFGMDNFRNEIVWCYNRASINQRQLAKTHDIIFWYSKGSEWIFNVDDIRMPYSEETIGRSRYDCEMMYGEKHILNPKGKFPNDWLSTIRFVQGNSDEYQNYPTQKPMRLYNRIIKASSNQGDVVLDPFCGSGTTLEAAKLLGRRWIGIDMNPEAIEITNKRLNPEQMDLF